MSMIRTVNLTKLYGGFTAVRDVSISIGRGEIYGLLGPNGAGKTTTILMLLGLLPPTSGEIHLFGEKFSPDRLELRKRIGVVPEKHPLPAWKWMTAYEYMAFFADLFDIRNKRERILDLLRKVGLQAVSNKRIIGFSKGMLQKLSIVRALLHNPDILFLDEPISGLDPIGVKQIRDLILAEHREGRSIFISSHQLSEVEKICQRVAIFSRGSLIVEDSVTGILDRFNRECRITVELESMSEPLLTQIRRLDFVLEATFAGRLLELKVKKEGEYKRRLSEFLFANKLLPLRIGEQTGTLEDAFITLTQEAVESFASPGAGA